MASAATAVLLDLDGVLVDSRTAISRSISYALAEQGFLQPSPASLERFIGPQLTLVNTRILDKAICRPNEML